MSEALPVSPAEALAVELNAAVAGRKAALELQRRYLSEDARAATNKDQFQVRVIEARLQAAGADPQAHRVALAGLAVAEAEALEAEAAADALLAAPGGRPVGLLRLVAGLMRAARINESKARSLISLARQGRRWAGGEQALALSAEHELLYLGLRRFEALLQKGGAWDPADVEWLRLRAVSLPARLAQTAAGLRAAAVEAVQCPLPAALQAARGPFLAMGLGPAEALAWSVAGFRTDEVEAWVAAAVPLPAEAALWRAHGIGLAQVQAWVQADLLPDEAALFGACGVEDPVLAHQLRAALGDVELLAAWHRAGYEPDEVLELRIQGCKQPDQARPPRSKGAEPAEVSRPVAAAAPPPVIAPPPPLRPAESWAHKRALRLFGVEAADDAAAFAVGLPPGAAWLGWGSFETQSLDAGGDERAFVWSQAGGSLLVLSASERLAPAAAVLELRDLRPDPLWQEGLDELRGRHQRPKQAGAWQLWGEPGSAALAWGLLLPQGPPPWVGAVDYQEGEAWPHRWARKTEEWGEAGQVAPVQMGRLDDGRVWITVTETLLLSGAAPVSRSYGVVKPAWVEALQEFCLKMEMPTPSPRWYLFAQALVPAEKL